MRQKVQAGFPAEEMLEPQEEMSEAKEELSEPIEDIISEPREVMSDPKLCSPTSHSPLLHASCSVCGSPAAPHLHYGAISCYSCRAFFRRGQPRQTRCITGSGGCVVTKQNRTSCKICRYNLCLQVGMKPDKVDATLGKRREKDARIVAAAKKYSSEVTRQTRETLATTNPVWSEIPALASKGVSETTDSYDRTRQEDHQVYRPYYEHPPTYQDTADESQLKWQSAFPGQYDNQSVPPYAAMKDPHIVEWGGSEPSANYCEFSDLRSQNMQNLNFPYMAEREHEVKIFPLINTQQFKTLAHGLNEKPCVSNQTSVIKRNVLNRHDLRKEYLPGLPLDTETRSHVLPQHEKIAVATADFQNPQVQTVINTHGAIKRYCERSTVITSEHLSGENTQNTDTLQSLISHDPRAVLYHFYNRRSKYAADVKQTVADRLINDFIPPENDIYKHDASKMIKEDKECNIFPTSFVQMNSNCATKVGEDDLDNMEHDIFNDIELDGNETKTTVGVPLKKRQRMMEVPYSMGHALNKSVLKVNFTLEEEFLLIDHMVRIKKYQNMRFDFLYQNFPSYDKLNLSFISCTNMGMKIPFNRAMEKHLFTLGLEFTKQNTKQIFQEMNLLSSNVRKEVLNTTYSALYVLFFSILEGNTKEKTWKDQHAKTLQITSANHDRLRNLISPLEHVRSISIKDQERFTSPWAKEFADEERFEKTIATVGGLLRDDKNLQALYHMLVMMTPSSCSSYETKV